jgi:DNA-binding FadR family transcriptional regulator
MRKSPERSVLRSGKAPTFVPISEEQVQRQMIDSNDPAEIVAAHLSIYRAIREGRLAAVTDAVEQVLRRKAFTFDRWVQENAVSFDNSGRT